jgi:hypothetical protein
VAETVKYFMLPEDERALFRLLARKELTLFPEVFPPGTAGTPVDEGVQERLVEPAYYLAALRLGPLVVRPLSRGKDRGMLEIEELPSPVFHYARSLVDEDGVLVGGRLWTEVDLHDDPGSRLGKPIALKYILDEISQFFRKTWRRSVPKGWWIGPGAAAAVKSRRLVLREPGHNGRTVGLWR